MPTASIETKQLSELFIGPHPFIGSYESNFYTAIVPIEAVGADLDIPAIGSLLVSNDTNFVPYLAQDISTVATSPLPDEAPICITLGHATGVGTNSDNLEATTGSTVDAIVLYRGPFNVNKDGMELTGIGAGDVDEFVVQLEKQLLHVMLETTTVDPDYVDYS